MTDLTFFRSNQRDLLLGEGGLSDLFNANQEGMSATTNFNFGPIVIRPHIAVDNVFQPEIGVFTATAPMAGLANTWECVVPGIAPGYFAITAEQIQGGEGLAKTGLFLINLPGPSGEDK